MRTIIRLLYVFFFMVQVLEGTQNSMITRFYNAKVVKDHMLTSDEVWISEGKIIAPQAMADKEIDVQGHILAPGYIDIQINGGWGIDFSSEADRVDEVAARLPYTGVTSFLPTLISLKPEDYSKFVPLLTPKTQEKHANILGMHLEGPFFNPAQRGAHALENMLVFKENDALETTYGTLEGVKIVTLAPEMGDALRAIRILRDRGIVVSIGHSNANDVETVQALDAGVTLVTHLFNAMTPFHHRKPAIIGAALTEKSLFYSVIVDGVHLSPQTVNIAWRSNPAGLVLITDAMAGLGLPIGKYPLGGMEVDVNEKGAYIAGTSTLAGSILSLDQAVRNLYRWTNCTIIEAIEAATLKPAILLGIQDKKGKIQKGYDADLIILDEKLNVISVFINGDLIF